MKIFINARFLTQPVSGVQRYAIECSRTIKSIYPDSVFLAPADIFNTEVAKELDVKVIGSRKGHLWEQLDLPSYLKKEGHPPLFNPCNTAPLFYNNNYITLHDLAFYHHPEWNSRAFSMWYNFLMPRLANKARHLFTVSRTMQQEIMDCYNVPENKISVTYNGISRGMKEMSKPVPKEKIILTVGSFNKRKNHHLLIHAFLSGYIKNTYKLVIVGDKNKVFSETGIDEATLQRGNIELCRQLGERELIDMYGRAEVLVSLSAYEGFGIPVLEGLYNGCKVVCSDIPVYRELYGDVAHFCNPADAQSVNAAIENAIAVPLDTATVNSLLTVYDYAASAKHIVGVIAGK